MLPCRFATLAKTNKRTTWGALRNVPLGPPGCTRALPMPAATTPVPQILSARGKSATRCIIWDRGTLPSFPRVRVLSNNSWTPAARTTLTWPAQAGFCRSDKRNSLGPESQATRVSLSSCLRACFSKPEGRRVSQPAGQSLRRVGRVCAQRPHEAWKQALNNTCRIAGTGPRSARDSS